MSRNYTERIEFVAKRDDRAILQVLAEADGISISGAIRRLVRQEARRRGLAEAAAFPIVDMMRGVGHE